jgi:hypothetical protein
MAGSSSMSSTVCMRTTIGDGGVLIN